MPDATDPLDELASRAAEAEHACDWERATELYEALFRALVQAGAVERIPEALMGSARAQAPDTATEAAEELAWLAHEIAERTGRMAAAAVSLNLVATFLHLRSDLAGARKLYAQALERARGLGDDALVAKTCLNLGVIENVTGNLREARARYLESVSAGIRSGQAEHSMRAYANLGIVCTDLEEWLEAQLHLDRGIEIAERLQDLPNQCVLHTCRIEPLIRLGELDAARAEADLTESLARRAGYLSCLSDVGRFRGMIAMAEGRLDEAEASLHDALEIAREHGLDLFEAETLEQVALLRDRQGRHDEAVDALEGAFERFFGLGARRDVSRVSRRLEEWREAVHARVRIGQATGERAPATTHRHRRGSPERRRTEQ